MQGARNISGEAQARLDETLVNLQEKFADQGINAFFPRIEARIKRGPKNLTVWDAIGENIGVFYNNIPDLLYLETFLFKLAATATPDQCNALARNFARLTTSIGDQDILRTVALRIATNTRPGEVDALVDSFERLIAKGVKLSQQTMCIMAKYSTPEMLAKLAALPDEEVAALTPIELLKQYTGSEIKLGRPDDINAEREQINEANWQYR